MAALAAQAAPSVRDLEQLRGRIEALQAELDQKEAARAEAAVLAGYRANLEALVRLERDTQVKRERLRAVEQASGADRQRIAREREARRKVLARTSGEIRKSRRQLDTLRADESRLSRL